MLRSGGSWKCLTDNVLWAHPVEKHSWFWVFQHIGPAHQLKSSLRLCHQERNGYIGNTQPNAPADKIDPVDGIGKPVYSKRTLQYNTSDPIIPENCVLHIENKCSYWCSNHWNRLGAVRWTFDATMHSRTISIGSTGHPRCVHKPIAISPGLWCTNRIPSTPWSTVPTSACPNRLRRPSARCNTWSQRVNRKCGVRWRWHPCRPSPSETMIRSHFWWTRWIGLLDPHQLNPPRDQSY